MILLAELHLGAFICLTTLLLVAFVALTMAARRGEPRETRRQRIVPVPRPRDKHASPEGWETRLREVAQELTTRLDNKSTTLDQLCRIAAQRIEQLEGLLERGTPVAGETRGEPAESPPIPSTTQASGLTRTDAPPLADADRAPVRGPSRRPSDPGRHEQIYALADDGHAPEEIALHLGVPVGEVELILGLRRQA